jgi:hypothetical protein
MRCFFSVFLFFPNCIKDEPTVHPTLSPPEKRREKVKSARMEQKEEQFLE